MNQLCLGFSFFKTAGGSSVSDSDSVSGAMVDDDASLKKTGNSGSSDVRSLVSESCVVLLSWSESGLSSSGLLQPHKLLIHY